MSVVTRIDHLERERFAEACRAFRPWFLAHLRDPDLERRDRALWAALGAPADGTWADIHTWLVAHPESATERAWDEVIEGVIDLLMEHPGDHVAIRAALARLAPHVGLCAGDPPLAILAALRAGLGAPG